jgi:hypothetical protein
VGGELLKGYDAREAAKESPFDVPLPSWWEEYELPDTWTVLQARHPTDQAALKLALEIISDGAETTLWDAPRLNIGVLSTIDKREIENLTELQALIVRYVGAVDETRPLNIAVFGTPGSGKSFAVKQIAGAVAARFTGMGLAIPELPFNLTQMVGPPDLSQALRKVEAQCGPSSIPLVFWDEFDRNLNGVTLGWLELFLMPMSDAKYTIANEQRSFGKALFTFAGGTCATYSEFEKSAKAQPPSTKAHDFWTRIGFHLDIPSINHPGKGMLDNFVLLRRAILIRSKLESVAPDLVQRATALSRSPIDTKVARGLLFTHQYKGGARSIDTIIRSSNLSGAYLRASDLPGEGVLQGHVELTDFKWRMAEIPDEDANEFFPTTFGWPVKNTDPRFLAWRGGA